MLVRADIEIKRDRITVADIMSTTTNIPQLSGNIFSRNVCITFNISIYIYVCVGVIFDKIHVAFECS